jgi:CTP:molybdopterin cytidylyltransferase MocA
VQPIGGLILAAGEGRRFGSPKQLALLHGRPLLEHALEAMAGARSVGPVVVVLGAHAQAILDAVALHGAQAVVAADWADGQAASLRAGVAALAARVEAITITLGDQPAMTAAAIDAVAAARDGESVAVRATWAGRPGHPVLLERALFAKVGELRGDEGARGLLEDARVRLVACDGLGADADIDTPSQLLSAGESSPAR